MFELVREFSQLLHLNEVKIGWHQNKDKIRRMSTYCASNKIAGQLTKIHERVLCSEDTTTQ